jgi:hypothetical protein
VAAGDNRRGRLFTVESVAGWVFADLLLVLFIVGLGSAIAYTPPEPPKPPKPEPKVERIVGMKTDPVSLLVEVDGARLGQGASLSKDEQQGVCRAIRSKVTPVKGERAALVLVFGGASDVETGQNVARAVGRQLGCADAKVFKGRVPARAFWDGSLPLGKARLEVFLYLRQESKR